MITVTHDVFALEKAFTISRGSRSEAYVLTVRITRSGQTGWGECVPYKRYGETTESVESQIMTLPDTVTLSQLQDLLPPGAARNAVDCALWDLNAKSCKKSVWQLAGLSEPKPQITAYTLSLETPENMRRQASKHAHRPILKIKLGTPDDMARLEAVRVGAPLSQIIVDANEGWTADIYAELAPHLVRLGVQMVEQPLLAEQDEMLAEMNRIVPVCADESCHDRDSLMSLEGKYDYVNIKLDKAGGLTEALALRKTAEQLGFKIMVGCMVGSSLAIAPAVLVAQDVDMVDLDAPILLAEDRDEPLKFDEKYVYPAATKLWG
ncbi:MAG: dipeptide epimerase [Aestuariivita sp.]|nr:dipeptide epimerase [Aestuariivita sp.]